ncbi:MAG: DEAD/DEAH box helicase [Ignavibacteriae bacterium]|nr:DEAD/DEAH box helicase [Ignavibacteriota bacterium]
MGFIKKKKKILKQLPHKLQTMLFSATVSKEITELSKKYLYNPVHVILESSIDPVFLQQTYYQTTPDQKIPLFIHLLKQERDLSLVFCNRKHITEKLANKLTKFGIQAKCLHGDMTQSQRERVTADFRHKRFNILIATDVASRGLHIEDITHVYNFEIPKDVDSYTHRVGRTARAGKKGEAISLVTNGEEQKFFKQILFSYRGNITLKRIDPAVLPKVDSFAQDKRKAKGDSRHYEEKPFHRNEKSRTWSEDKPRRFRRDKEKSFGENKPKVWNDEKPRSYRSDRKKSFGDSDKKKSFGDNVPKIWTEDKPRSYGSDRKKSFGGEKKSFDGDKPKVWGEDKSRSYRSDKKKSFGGEKKSFSDDKPKVWGEDKR